MPSLPAPHSAITAWTASAPTVRCSAMYGAHELRWRPRRHEAPSRRRAAASRISMGARLGQARGSLGGLMAALRRSRPPARGARAEPPVWTNSTRAPPAMSPRRTACARAEHRLAGVHRIEHVPLDAGDPTTKVARCSGVEHAVARGRAPLHRPRASPGDRATRPGARASPVMRVDDAPRSKPRRRTRRRGRAPGRATPKRAAPSATPAAVPPEPHAKHDSRRTAPPAAEAGSHLLADLLHARHVAERSEAVRAALGDHVRALAALPQLGGDVFITAPRIAYSSCDTRRTSAPARRSRSTFPSRGSGVRGAAAAVGCTRP